ncbi:MAG: Ribosome-binding factor A [Parcubacteria group bacterium Gr01-1014_72]|jgi:ribosome-binding factor A|nr:MAG: Ribosome-binding factor A [Parcubacteria group bacterium Gr01-1014_72]
MTSVRSRRAEETYRKLAAEFIERESDNTSLITVTSALFDGRARRCVIRVTVLPDSEQEKAIAFLNRRQGDFADFARSRVRSGAVPMFSFTLDLGEKNRQKIDALSQSS